MNLSAVVSPLSAIRTLFLAVCCLLLAQIVEDIAILHVVNGNDFFCMVNASLSADSCAAVCTAYARLGNRKSDVTTLEGSSSVKIRAKETDGSG
jgi:hypothetical protein